MFSQQSFLFEEDRSQKKVQALIREVSINPFPALVATAPLLPIVSNRISLGRVSPHQLEGSRISPTAGPRGALRRAEPVVRATISAFWILILMHLLIPDLPLPDDCADTTQRQAGLDVVGSSRSGGQSWGSQRRGPALTQSSTQELDVC